MSTLLLAEVDQQIADLLKQETDQFSTDQLSTLVEQRYQIIIDLHKQFGDTWSKAEWQLIAEQTELLSDKILQRKHKLGKEIQEYQYGRRKIDIYNKNR